MNVLYTHLLHAFARLLPYHGSDDDGAGGDGDGANDGRAAHVLQVRDIDHDGDDDGDGGHPFCAGTEWYGA